VVPGFLDAHAHFLGLGQYLDQVDLRACRDFDELLERVRRAVDGLAPGTFLLGRGWNQEDWPGREYPSHERLSAITPGHPVLLTRRDGHARLANAKAMEMADLRPDARAPEGGEILRRDDGRPTGVFVDKAMELLPRPPASTFEQRARWASLAQEACLRAGIVGCHDAGVEVEELEAIERLLDEDALHLRLNGMLNARFDESGAPVGAFAGRLARGPEPARKDGRLWTTAVKIYADGALGSHGALLLEPYADRCGVRGLELHPRKSFFAQLRGIRAAGFQAAVHAIGDAATRLVLDGFEAALGQGIASDHRWRVEHAQLVHPDDLERFARLGVIASVQPTHCTSDADMTDQRLGPERTHHAHPWRRLVDCGARLALGSDFPIEDPSPLEGLQAAVARTRADGYPPGGWRPEDALTIGEALAGFTSGAAFAGFQEPELGTLRAGKRADFVVLSRDPVATPPGELASLAVEATWIAGCRRFSASP
jgi:predicted amidohydrolase YtcJ